MKLIINPSSFPSTYAAVEGILGEMKSRRSGHSGYCVAYRAIEDTNVECKRPSRALENALYDLASWGRIHRESITLFRNGNQQITAMLTSEKE